jgi:FkbM family methyltransferase
MDRVHGHTFFSRLVREDSVVVDLGANVGGFSREMEHKYGCVCYAVEPNPESYARLETLASVRPFNMAIADHDGTLRFYVAANSEASSMTRTSDSDREIEVSAMRLDAFAQREHLGQIDLLKVDVEGAEVELIDSLSDAFLGNIVQIAMEFHDFCGLVDKRDVARLERRLEALGFLSINFSRESHGHEDHLFVNTNRCNVGRVEFLLAKYLVRNMRGAARMAARRLRRRPRS